MTALKWLTGLAIALLILLWLGGTILVRGAGPQLETLLSTRTGLETTVAGDLHWRPLWPTAISATNIRATDPGGNEHWELAWLRLSLSPLSMLLAPRSPERWRITALTLKDLEGARGPGAADTADTATRYAVSRFRLQDLASGEAAPFDATLRYRDGTADPIDLALSGKLRLVAADRQLVFAPVMLDSDEIRGRCEADLTLRPRTETTTALSTSATASASAVSGDADGVLNIDRWRRTDWNLDCQLDHLRWAGADFADVTLRSNNLQGVSLSELTLPSFFSGSAQLNAAVDATTLAEREVPRWVMTPIIENAAAQDLHRWLQRVLPDDQQTAGDPADLIWEGPVSMTGRIESHGNRRSTLLGNARGELTLVSNNGTLDLSATKARAARALAELRGLVQGADVTAQWPAQLEYLTLTGRWLPQGDRQQLDLRLDNVLLSMTTALTLSDTDPALDSLRSKGTLTFSTKTPPNSLPVPPLLQDLPLPLRCTGRRAQPDCSLDTKAAQRLLADAMRGGANNTLGDKLDALIEENVPEEYRAAARGLLEILGHNVSDDEAGDDFLDLEEDEAPLAEPAPQ